MMKERIKHIVYLGLFISLGITMSMLRKNFYTYALNNNASPFPTNNNLSILTYNIDASDSSKFSVEYLDSLIDLLQTVNAGIICFQELSVINHQKIKPRIDTIYRYSDSKQPDDQIWGVYFFSRYPIRNFKRYKTEGHIQREGLRQEEIEELELYRMQMNVMSAEFEVEPTKWVTVFFEHLRSSSYSTARRSMDGEVNWLKGVSLYWRNYKIGKRIRDYEAENVRRFIDEAREEGNAVIMAGDLNDWCGSYCLKTLMGDDLKDAWSEGGRGFGWTFFGWGLRLRLDHILYSDELELVDVKVVDSYLSDHKPLVAKFRLN